MAPVQDLLGVLQASVRDAALPFLSTQISSPPAFRDTGVGMTAVSHCSLLILVQILKVSMVCERKCGLHGQSKELGSIPHSVACCRLLTCTCL